MTTLEIACPKCNAKPGERCVALRGKSTGKPLEGTHTERDDAAVMDDDRPILTPDIGGSGICDAKREDCLQLHNGLCLLPKVDFEACDHRPKASDPAPAEPVVDNIVDTTPAVTDIKYRTLFRQLKCALPDWEIAHKALEIRKFELQVERIQSDARTMTKPLKERIAALKTEIDDGEERRIECQEVKEFSTNSLRVIRMDTGEEIERRALTAEERQQELPLVDPQPPAAEPPPAGLASKEPHPALAVYCPACSADPGKPCVDEDDVPLDQPHDFRIEDAEFSAQVELPDEPEADDLEDEL